MFLTLLMTLAVGASAAPDEPVLEALQAFHEDGQFDGAALVYRNGEPILRQGFGLADVDRTAPNTPDTRFEIASITKAFTATLVLQLVQDEKWTLESPIGEFIPEIKEPTVRAITLQQLLVHSSGIGRDHTEYFLSDRQDLGFEDLVHEVPEGSLGLSR